MFSEIRGIVIYFGTLVKKQVKGIKKDITKENKPRGKIKSGKTKSPTMRLPSRFLNSKNRRITCKTLAQANHNLANPLYG